MTTVTQIKQALKSLLSTITDVDRATIDHYLPPVETKHIALVIPPFGQQTRTEVLTTGGSKFVPESKTVMESLRIRCEFWVKLDSARVAYCLSRSSDIPKEAIALLFAHPTLNGTVDRMGNFGSGSDRQSIDAETIDRPIEIAGIPYIVVSVIVPVIAYAKED